MKNILHWVRRPSACIRCAGVSPASGTQASRLPYFFLVLALLFSSCEKDKDTLPKDRILLTTEKHLSPEKTSVSGTTVQWVNGDMVRLCVGATPADLSVAISGTNAYVKGWSGGVVHAYYPNTIIGEETGEADDPTVIIPSRYNSTYSDGRQVLALPMVGRAESGATAVEFKHLTAALMVKLKNDTLSPLTLDSVVVSSRQYLLSGTMGLNFNEENYGAVAQETSDSNAVTVRFSGFTIGTGSIETVQIPIRPIGVSNLRIQVYAHCQGAAISSEGVPAVPTTLIYHYNDTKHVAALGRNVMMAAGIALSAGGHTSTDTVDNALFSVSSTKKVYFSEGNLWYHNSAYSFHTPQYKCNGASQSDSDKDLFPWATAVATTVDGWNILSAEEWRYLINDRPGNRFVKACVNNVNGLIIFSDTYRHPIDQKLKNVNAKESSYSANEFTIGQWQSMEAAGAIFLPAAGCHNGTSVVSFGGEGDYWSSTEEENDKAKRLEFQSDEVTTDNGIIGSYGCSVRLVKVATH